MRKHQCDRHFGRCRKRRELRERLAAGDIDILIGTTALNNDDEIFANLGLVIVDEQHRFGVRQRAQLLKKDGNGAAVATALAGGVDAARSAAPPHVLFMTATPIPRTIAMTLMSHMTTSALDELPPGRLPVQCALTLRLYQVLALPILSAVYQQCVRCARCAVCAHAQYPLHALRGDCLQAEMVAPLHSPISVCVVQHIGGEGAGGQLCWRRQRSAASRAAAHRRRACGRRLSVLGLPARA